jgi:hypothetical protein
VLAYVFSHRPASGADTQAYEDALRRFHTELAGGRPSGVALWRRMMVLGPPPEFCLVSRELAQLPAELAPEVRVRRKI